jgi:hypothetical protein
LERKPFSVGDGAMRFNICYGNHGNGVGVEDIITYVRNAIRVAGHEAFISPYLAGGSYNVVVECFPDEFAAQIFALKQKTPARFIVIATEYTDGKTFNPQTAGADIHYGQAAYWQQRFDAFQRVAAVADAVWCMSRYQVESYREFLGPLPVFELPRGFDPLSTPPLHPKPEAKDIDLLFTGNVTAHRQAVLARLSQSFVTVTAAAHTLNTARIDLICRAKACLHINLVAGAQYNSLARNHFLIMNKGPTLSERARFPGEVDDFIVEVDSDTIAEQIGGYLASGRWKTQGEEMYERYRAARPIAAAVEQLIAQSTRVQRNA